MHVFLIAHSLLLVASLSSALLLPPTNFISSNGSSPLGFPTTPRSNSTSPLFNDLIHCNGQLYGSGLNKRSCENAWDKMGRSSTPQQWYPSQMRRTTSLPIRYLSDDGLCAIDVKLAGSSRGDISSELAIAGITESILLQCVEDRSRVGGRGIVPCKLRTFSRCVSSSCLRSNGKSRETYTIAEDLCTMACFKKPHSVGICKGGYLLVLHTLLSCTFNLTRTARLSPFVAHKTQPMK